MSDQNPSASQLLREAVDDLPVDVARIVRGGLDRGRTLRRRRRAGASLAAVAMVGVIGVAASVGPGVLRDDASSPSRVADPAGSLPGTPGTTTLTGEDALTYVRERYEATAPPRGEVDALVTVSAGDVPGIVGDRVGGEVGSPLTEPPYGVVDDRQRKLVHFLLDGTLTTFSIERADSLATCVDLVDPADQPDGQPGGICQIEDGAEVLRTPTETADGVAYRGIMVWRHGYVVSVGSYNAAEGKDVAPVTEDPPLSDAELTDLALDEVWFTPSGS